MAKMVGSKTYTVEFDQDEAETILLLTGGQIKDSDGDEVTDVKIIADRIWEAMDAAVRGARTDYEIDGATYQDSSVVVS